MLVVDLVGLRRMESPEWRLSGFGCSGALIYTIVTIAFEWKYVHLLYPQVWPRGRLARLSMTFCNQDH